MTGRAYAERGFQGAGTFYLYNRVVVTVGVRHDALSPFCITSYKWNYMVCILCLASSARGHGHEVYSCFTCIVV